MISSIHLHTNRKSPPLDLFKVLIILVVLLTFPKTNNSLLPRTSRLSLPIFGKRSIIKKLPNINVIQFQVSPCTQFFSLSGWLLMFYLVMVQPPFFPSFQQVPRIFHSSIRFTSSSQPGRGPGNGTYEKHVPMDTKHSDKHWLITQKTTYYIFI